MKIKILDPNEYRDWDALLLRSNNHNFFHTSAWAKVLKSTYGFKPLYFVLLDNKRLDLLLPLMEVYNPLKQKKGVSLPFTDLCSPFVQKIDFLKDALQSAIEFGEEKKWKYIELRADDYFEEEISPWDSFYVHDIDLLKTESELFSALSNSNRRSIRKATKEGLSIKIDHSFDSMKSFYQLNCITRKRHGLPPQPYTFFQNVFEYILSKGFGTIVSASHKGEVIAASVFFNFGTKVLFKYGASEIKYQNLRPNNLIMWEALKWYRDQGFNTLNLGRTEITNHGLVRYKRTWGAKESVVKYYRYNLKKEEFLKKSSKKSELFTKFLSQTPIIILRIIGRLFYKYAG